MPRYEYRCRTCDERFEVWRSMSDATLAAPCPDGHTDTVKVLSMFATTGAAVAAGPSSAGRTGGCCGGACGCSH